MKWMEAMKSEHVGVELGLEEWVGSENKLKEKGVS